ncbi:HAD family hydrolase [Candidatus Nitrosacidococcus tergens]|uniref:HAD-superfamily hydrolase, subfamily IB n=1 Tax=Candidatus Nitrosacidococcus tergens TaxID=553981 RepID=A0A7G1QA03_9GAMM|nr:HAD family hydrolase [Candidatus Nitrosacidococcus tergens]CAB1275715.1 HAD-superfamily hydrolase, subfamily IB [Candidatus Nitrosacidococcus tergens]
MHKGIAFFDFDGTLTYRDSIADFILFSKSWSQVLLGGIVLSPTLLAYGLKLQNNSLAKGKALTYFFGGMPESELIEKGQQYAEQRIPQILKPTGLEKIHWHQQQNHKVVIVSASIDLWLQGWTKSLDMDLIATQLETVNGLITGKYVGENCYGEEKVRRIKAAYDVDNYSEIYAYGDTPGDKPMLALAHFPFYRPFK